MSSFMADVYNELENASPFIDLKWVWIPFLISLVLIILVALYDFLPKKLKELFEKLKENNAINVFKHLIAFAIFFFLMLSMYSLQDIINIYINARQNDSDILDFLLCLKKISYFVMCISIYFSLRADKLLKIN